MSAQQTPGPWTALRCGGASVVISSAEPPRNDTRIPAYGYDEKRGYSIAYPFIEDSGSARLDFVCFSHADARLTAAAPDLLWVCQDILEFLRRSGYDTRLVKAAIARATGDAS